MQVEKERVMRKHQNGTDTDRVRFMETNRLGRKDRDGLASMMVTEGEENEPRHRQTTYHAQRRRLIVSLAEHNECLC